MNNIKMQGVELVDIKYYCDNRGSFLELYRHDKNNEVFLQDNLSFSKENVLRGMHYQVDPFSQGKLVFCISGLIYDVVVDIRKNSPTFGMWMGFWLSPENEKAIWIPPGFAHGFFTLKESYLLYKITNTYNKDSERTLLWNDSTVAIQWPLFKKDGPLLSDKDVAGKIFEESEYFL